MKKKFKEIEPDEIFSDAENLPNFNVHQLEGRLSKPITKRVIFAVGLAFLFVGLVFMSRIGFIQIAEGKTYFNLSERNRLQKIPIIAPRGIIYDRNGVELAWNREGTESIERAYKAPGFAHVLGFVNYPTKDKAGFYWRENGLKIIETDVFGDVHSENVVTATRPGENITLAIDSRLQEKLFDILKNTARSHFTGGVGILIDLKDGGLLTLVNFPEFDSEIVSLGKDREAIASFSSDKRKVFLNRAVSGLYTPGSTVKPFLATAALKENIITPDTRILSTGSIALANPYNPNQFSVFNDWKAHGFVDIRDALAVSSNVYFYEIGGGFESQPGLGISRIEKYLRLFGLGEKTSIDLEDEAIGTIPNPTWKKERFPGDIWRIGDTYNTAIGQYGFQVTPLQLARATGAIATDGRLLTPHLRHDASVEESVLAISPEIFQVVREGMQQAVTTGTATSLNFGNLKVAAKTGTAQIGLAKDHLNSWVIGFAPFTEPRFAFTVLLEDGPKDIGISAQMVMSQLLVFMIENTPEYFN